MWSLAIQERYSTMYNYRTYVNSKHLPTWSLATLGQYPMIYN